MYRYLFAAALILSVPSAALAGGGSTKATARIRAVNRDSSLTVLVAVDPSSSLSSATTMDQFTDRGGKIINPGGNMTFSNLRAGNRSLVFAFVDSSTTSLSASDFSSRTVRVTSGRTTTVNLSVPSSSSSSSSGN